MSLDKLENVYFEIDKGNMNTAYRKILPMLNAGDAEAEYVYAMYITHENETAEEFDKRSLKYIKLAANQLYPPALYRLGILHQTGEGVARDQSYAYELFKRAAYRGHGLAKKTYALALYSGMPGFEKNQKQARKLIMECVEDNVDGAEELLRKWD